jgi:hypothetical protein
VFRRLDPPNARRRRHLVLAGIAAALATAGVSTLASASYVDDHEIELVSRTQGPPSEVGDNTSSLRGISSDGRYVLLGSRASQFPWGELLPGEDWVSGANSFALFRKDRETGEVDLVARPARKQGNVFTHCGLTGTNADMSADGRYVAFSTMEQLHPSDTNFLEDVYVRDMTKAIGTNPAQAATDDPLAWELVSSLDGPTHTAPTYSPARTSCGAPSDLPGTRGGSSLPSNSEAISADGRRVIFNTLKTSNLPDGTAANTPRLNLFWRDLDSDETRTVTRDRASGLPVGIGGSVPTLLAAALSGDGSKVAWIGSHGPAQTSMDQPKEYGRPQDDQTVRHTFWRDVVAEGGTAAARRPAPLIDMDDDGCTAALLGELDRDEIDDYSQQGPCLGAVAHDTHEQAGASGRDLALSHDGMTVAWTMVAVPRPSTRSVGGGGAWGADAWVTSMDPDLSRKAATRIVTRAPVPSGEETPPGQYAGIERVSLSADGRLLALRTDRTEFSSLTTPAPVGPMPTLASSNVFRVTLGADRTPQVLELVTHGADECGDPVDMNGGGGDGLRYSADGSAIAFDSDASNLVAGAGSSETVPAKTDVFVSTPLAGPVGPGPCDPPPDPGGGGDTGGGGDFGGGGGGTTTPPPPPPAGDPPAAGPARVRLGAAKVNRKGVVQLRLSVPGPGALQAVATAPNARASQRRKRKVTYGRGRATAPRAGAVTLTVKPTSAGRKLMRRRRALPVQIKVTYRPRSGPASTSTKRVTVRRPARR